MESHHGVTEHPIIKRPWESWEDITSRSPRRRNIHRHRSTAGIGIVLPRMTWESLDLLLRSLFHAPSYNIQNNIDFYISTLTKANLVSQKIVVLAMPSRDAHCMAKPPFVIAKDPLAWSMLSRIFGCLTHLPLRKRVYVGERVFHMPLSSMCHVTTLCL